MAPKIADKQAGSKSNRQEVLAPYIPLAVLRTKMQLTLTAVAARIFEETGVHTDRGTLSAIENGHRGASQEMIAALAAVYGIDPTCIDTQYVPRRRPGGRK